MYTREEYEKRIADLEPVAMDLIMNKHPNKAREIASKMSSEDAYILGIHIGAILKAAKLVPVGTQTDEKNN